MRRGANRGIGKATNDADSMSSTMLLAGEQIPLARMPLLQMERVGSELDLRKSGLPKQTRARTAKRSCMKGCMSPVLKPITRTTFATNG